MELEKPMQDLLKYSDAHYEHRLNQKLMKKHFWFGENVKFSSTSLFTACQSNAHSIGWKINNIILKEISTDAFIHTFAIFYCHSFRYDDC